ncbi:energy transducer TonB [Mucilaginibacter sp. OK098]|uniref:energy transducer TonB n=1 Tax=Mucilaginibacter sp. OK098 TaxID=1855297 RepID=UPI000916D2A8|nr:energy transducer TonB [Mucilaginibacter sp. OK098]SHM09756.1 TonB family C-terminal domain-containing protein [Mucilaginibacter sp. OK098]
MKKTLLLVFITLIGISFAKAQKPDTIKDPVTDTTIFASVQHQPEFPGSNDQFSAYIAKNIRYPKDAREKTKQGRVIVQMIIEKDGSISHVKIVRKIFPSLDAEAVKVISSSPKWNPGMQNGYPVRVIYTMPISFNLGRTSP